MSSSEFAAIDEQRLGAFHWRAMLTTGLGVFCDGYDISSISLVLGPALKAYGVARMTNFEAGALTASALVGSALGALAFGLLAQKGRKRFYGFDMAILGVAALAQAFMPTLGWLIACRFVLGLGVGADYVLSPTIMAEHANRRDRGRTMSLGFGVMWPVGALAAALVKLALDALRVPPDLSWRIVLAGGALPALAVLYFRRAMPETARYLARIGADGEEAMRVMEAIGGAPAAAPAADERPFGQVFARHARHIFSAALIWMVYDLVVYAAVLFGPNLIAQNLGMAPAVYTALTQTIFVLPASLVIAWFLIDGLGRKPLQVGGFLAAAAVLVVFAIMRARPGGSAVLAFVVYGLFNVAQTGPGLVAGAGMWGVELAPTRIRSVAQSVTVVGGRIGASISAFLFPVLFGRLGLFTSMMLLAGLAVLGGLLSQALVPETSGRSLEEISLEEAPAT
ncbi:MAG: MFS transporter [Caulobacteraceae bacterium]